MHNSLGSTDEESHWMHTHHPLTDCTQEPRKEGVVQFIDTLETMVVLLMWPVQEGGGEYHVVYM